MATITTYTFPLIERQASSSITFELIIVCINENQLDYCQEYCRRLIVECSPLRMAQLPLVDDEVLLRKDAGLSSHSKRIISVCTWLQHL